MDENAGGGTESTSVSSAADVAGPTNQLLQEEEIRRMDRTCRCRSDKVPVTPTRWPTWLERRAWFPGYTTSTAAAPFLKNALFQLRALGAYAPSVSVKRYVSFDRSRQPKIVTGAVFAAAVLDASASDFGAASDGSAAMVDTAGFG